MRAPLRTAWARRLFGATAVASVMLIACDGEPTEPDASGPQAAVNSAGTPFAVEFFVQAHQDDWQLFLGDRAALAVPTASRVVFVYTTAGDAGSPESDGYWQARERAAEASIDSMTPAGSWACATQAVNSHALRRCTKGNTVSYYLRLPDGNGEGQGYPPDYGSLARLQSGTVSSLRAVDGSATYTSWGDLVATLQALLALEAAGQPDANLAVHVADDDREVNGSDHSDHLTTGDLIRAAAAGRQWNLFWYMGYQSMFEEPNLTTEQHETKWKLIVAYDLVLRDNYGTIIGTSHAEEWSERTIYRSELSTDTSTSPPPPPPPATTVPAAPTELTASGAGGTRIDLAWSDNSADEEGFRIERAPDVEGAAGTFVEAGVVSANVAVYSVTDVQSDTRYWFRVRAYNAAGPSAYTNEASALIELPAAPSSLVATAAAATRIDLTWTDNAPDEQGFRIERAADAGGVPGVFAEIATVGPDVGSFSNTGLQGSTSYWYRVRAYNLAGVSDYSNMASTTTPEAPATTFGVEVYFSGHQDDWQLFYGDRATASTQSTPKVVYIYTTAGDGGDFTSGYWEAREDGANASVDSITPAGSWSCGGQLLNGHVVRRCTKANTVSYFFRLPDGNSDGGGYGSGSLGLLHTGAIASLGAVDGSATYTSWDDLVTTAQAAVALETAGEVDSRVAVHSLDWDTELNSGDHPDHQTTGSLVRAASVGHAWNLYWYIGYPTMNMEPNLSEAEQAAKWRVIVAYDDVLKGNYGTIVGTSHAEEWSERTVYRVESSSGVVVAP